MVVHEQSVPLRAFVKSGGGEMQKVVEWSSVGLIAVVVLVLWNLFDRPQNQSCINTITKTPIEHCR